jgi:putative colanic acid biosynthesis glycosyltransferase
MQHFQNLADFKRHESQKIRQDRAMVSVSIVTVVKNNADGLTKTLKSALSQDFPDWELKIVYGQSEDSTYDVAIEFCKLDSRISIVTQEDQGIYEAMNLGIAVSCAKFVWFMNSGDQFYSPTSLNSGFAAIRNAQIGFVVGGYKVENDVRLFKQRTGKLTQIKFLLSRRGACHQAMIFRKDSLLNAGNFDTQFRIAADYKLCLEVIADAGARKLPEILAIMEPDGVSDKNLFVMHAEKAHIRRQIFTNNPMARAIGWCWMKAARVKIMLRHLISGKKHPFG